jgi:pyrimidine operon attenuation protein/uracil phosphoribosyltransferase
MDEAVVFRSLRRISHEIIEKNNGCDDLAIVGIFRRGVPLAYQIADNIAMVEGKKPPVGKLDISLYRDDITEITKDATLIGTDIDFDINNKKIILVDDVLFTGRTVRAAIEGLMKLGRPASIQLAVLVDRGHRELPIRPDFVGKNIPTSSVEIVNVHLKDIDGENLVLLDVRE